MSTSGKQGSLAQQLTNELSWLKELIFSRQGNFSRGSNEVMAESLDFVKFPAPAVTFKEYGYGAFLAKYELDTADRLLLILSMANHIDPMYFLRLFDGVYLDGETSRKFCFAPGTSSAALLPTGLTYVYLMGGTDVKLRLEAHRNLVREHLFSKLGLLVLEPHFKGDPTLSGRLVVEERWVEKLLYPPSPEQSSSIKYPGVTE